MSQLLHRERMPQRWSNTRRGISLLEIILSIGILGASLAVLSSIIMNAADAALDAKERAIVQLLAEQQIAQTLLNSSIMPVPFSDRPLMGPDGQSTYLATMQTQQGMLQGTLVISVTVRTGTDMPGRPQSSVTLVRWMVDPTLGLEELEAEEEAAAEEAAAASESGGA